MGSRRTDHEPRISNARNDGSIVVPLLRPSHPFFLSLVLFEPSPRPFLVGGDSFRDLLLLLLVLLLPDPPRPSIDLLRTFSNVRTDEPPFHRTFSLGRTRPPPFLRMDPIVSCRRGRPIANPSIQGSSSAHHLPSDGNGKGGGRWDPSDVNLPSMVRTEREEKGGPQPLRPTFIVLFFVSLLSSPRFHRNDPRIPSPLPFRFRMGSHPVSLSVSLGTRETDGERDGRAMERISPREASEKMGRVRNPTTSFCLVLVFFPCFLPTPIASPWKDE